MAHSSWGSGWPNCQPSRINSGFIVSGTKFPGGMRNELVDLTSMLVQETKNRGYRFGSSSDPSYGCWGYSCRAISGSNSPSNHSWGLAVDINAPSNPYTSPLVTDMPGWMPDLWNEYGFRWGGDYSGDMDAMHYEFMESVSAAASYTDLARSRGLGGLNPIEPEDWWDAMSDEEKAQLLGDVAAIKTMLANFHPRAVHWGDGANHYYSFGDGTYIQVPDPMGDGGVHARFRENLLQAGTELVEWQGPGQPLADAFTFGNRIPWSDRP